jgi:hypothetical protein
MKVAKEEHYYYVKEVTKYFLKNNHNEDWLQFDETAEDIIYYSI